MTQLLTWYQTIPMLHGAVLGFWAAFGVDLKEFIGSTGWTVAGWKLSVASKRWVTGALIGAGFNGGLG